MIYIGILTVTTNVYGSRRTLRFGIVLDKKRKGIEDKIKETYRKKFEERCRKSVFQHRLANCLLGLKRHCLQI